MKKLILSASFAFALLTTSNTFAQQGFGTNQPNKSAAVDIVSSKRGLLIPRIDIPDLNNAAPVNSPATSLFVYNTNTASGVGFYYWDGSKWVRFTSTNNERDVIVQAAANGNIDIPTATYDANGVKTYNVSVKGGADGQVLVSNATGGTEWTDPNTFVLDVLTAGNAIGIVADPLDPTKLEVKFNGTLSENTTIATGSHDLAITGLGTVNAMTADDKLVIMDENGLLKTISKTDLVDAKNLTSTGGIITLNGAAAVNNSVLAGVELGIADRSIDPGKFKAEVTDEGKVPVVKNDGTVEWTTIPGTNSADLTTDGKIVIGNNTSTTQTLADAVLVATELSIAAESITSGDIKDGTIQVNDIKAPGTTTDSSTGGTVNQVMVTNATGDVSWIDQSDLGNKDSYTGIGAINIAANGVSANGGVNYDVSVATATGTTLGVVKEVATAPTVNINSNGELAVNTTNTVLAGDVTGSLNTTKVEAIQGTAVSATAPTTDNNVLVYNGTAWTPTELTGSHITGAALTSSTLNVSNTTNTALLEALTLEIKPGTTGQVLTTTGAVGSEVATWAAPNTLVDVRNGINKDNADYIELGGDLMRPTAINTGVTEATNTLAITGLVNPAGADTDKIMIVEDNGVLRTIVRSLSDDVTADYTVSSITGYNSNVQEINLKATISSSDIEITLPAASAANKGQVVNIGIANTTEPNFYVNIIANGGTLTYGSMPYQGWIVKSNGDAWVIVGRN